MQVANRDLFPADSTIQQYESVRPLLVQPLLDDEFNRHNVAAVKAKKQYHRYGQLAILLVAFSAIITIAEALIFPDLFKNVALSFLAVSMAFLGIFLQCYIILTHQKKRWLLNRYASEFIRSLKFQSFVLSYQAKNDEELATMAQQFAMEKIDRLNNSLNAGYAIMTDFSPGKITEQLRQFSQQMPKNAELGLAAHDAFNQLRYDYQKNFALNQIEGLKGRRRLFNSTQDMIYLAAAVFAFISLGAKILAYQGTEIPTDWIDFTAITLFILGATEAIMDNALLEEQSQARFEQYVRDLNEAKTQLDAIEGESFPDYVMGVEKICLGELGEFCRSAERISYRF